MKTEFEALNKMHNEQGHQLYLATQKIKELEQLIHSYRVDHDARSLSTCFSVCQCNACVYANELLGEVTTCLISK